MREMEAELTEDELAAWGERIGREARTPMVVALRGDWSRPSADISAFLQRRGSVAVPFNQIYGPGSPDGVVLSPLLTRDAVLQTLSHAKGTEQ